MQSDINDAASSFAECERDSGGGSADSGGGGGSTGNRDSSHDGGSGVSNGGSNVRLTVATGSATPCFGRESVTFQGAVCHQYARAPDGSGSRQGQAWENLRDAAMRATEHPWGPHRFFMPRALSVTCDAVIIQAGDPPPPRHRNVTLSQLMEEDVEGRLSVSNLDFAIRSIIMGLRELPGVGVTLLGPLALDGAIATVNAATLEIVALRYTRLEHFTLLEPGGNPFVALNVVMFQAAIFLLQCVLGPGFDIQAAAHWYEDHRGDLRPTLEGQMESVYQAHIPTLAGLLDPDPDVRLQTYMSL